MNNSRDIEKLAQQTFSNFEADVPAEAWTNIQNALLLSPAVPANTAGNAKTAGGIFSKINSVVLWSSSIAVVSLVAGWLYFSSSEEPKQENLLQDEIIAAPAQEQPVEKPISNSTNQPINQSATPILQKEKSNNIAVADDKNTSHQTFSANEEIEPMAKAEPRHITESPVSNSKPVEIEPAHQNATPLINDSKSDDAEIPEDYNTDESDALPGTIEDNSENTADAASLGSIPNVITPNNDNENDIFIIEGNGLKSLKVSIKDRTGKTIHEWNGLHGFWDGKLENGSDAKPGIYFYNIFAISEKGKPLTKKNSFSLIR